MSGKRIRLFNQDCLTVMRNFEEASIDLVLCDLPYGITKNRWDFSVPLDSLWSCYQRILKKKGAIVLTCSQPFTSMLVMSNLDWFRWEYVWVKNRPVGFLQVNVMPMRQHETILVFGRKGLKYRPQFVSDIGMKPVFKKEDAWGKLIEVQETEVHRTYSVSGVKYKDIKKSSGENKYVNSVLQIGFSGTDRKKHTTQKPVDLMEFMIRSYSDLGDVILDNCMGSGTTGVACLKTGRRFIGIEKDEEIFEIAKERLIKACYENGVHTSEMAFL